MTGNKGIGILGIAALLLIGCSTATVDKKSEAPTLTNHAKVKQMSLLRRHYPHCGEKFFRQAEVRSPEERKWLGDDNVGTFALGWKAGSVEGIVQLTSDPLIQPCDILSDEELKHIRDRRNWIIVVVQGVKEIAGWFGGKIVDAKWNPNKNGEVLVKEQCFSGETKIRRVFKDGKIAIEY